MAEQKATQKKKPRKPSFIGRLLSRLIMLAIVAGVALAAGAWWWIDAPVSMTQSAVEVEIAPGTSARAVAQTIVNAGVQTHPELLYQYFRWSGQARAIRAGSYEFTATDTPRSILEKLVLGAETYQTIVFVEGWTFAQIRQRLAQAPDIKHDTAQMTDAQIMEALGKPGVHPEGMFFPDTYTFSKGSSDLHILRRAMHMMDKTLEQVWQERDQGLPLKTPYEALILASIIEKETGRPQDRFMVAGVFTNRLNRGMLLQTDPTVVYGLGDSYTGRITRRNLDTDTPYNTYTRAGLTPTPIAMPGRDSLLAAVHPAKTSALYFVSRGDGSSHFSDSLNDHNRAVDHYIRGRSTPPRPSSTVSEQ
ncbi:endolytic transglycosylase MltG [Saezia sanguinis]|uniref:endolytic transglycosylase MltG n=1 Tax=Saezia sanguinis TaxID=1965230 RepID=UPI0030DAE2EB